MDFFARQEHARRRTGWLVGLFFAALAGLIFTAYLVLANLVVATADDPAYGGAPVSLWDPGLFIMVAGAISLVVFGGTTYKLAQLRHGGGKVAEMLGGKRLDPASRQLHERRLLNVVEEMALASGVPVPPVYVMPGEKGINAFAAGYTIHDAVVGVTEGTMRGLTREELQGVVAHEFSHILNGDMRLNIRLIGILHGLLVLAIIGRILLHFASSGRSRSSKKDNGAIFFLALGLALLIIGYAGYFFGGIIKRAVSRQREYLADASAVQFTRNPIGLASALKKVGGLSQGGRIANDHAEELSHMFFADGIKRMFGGDSLFATHPPLARRVKLLDPTFNGTFEPVTEESLFRAAETEKPPPKKGAPRPGVPFAGPDFIKGTVMAGGMASGTPMAILQQVGILGEAQLDAAGGVLDAIPDSLRDAVHDPLGAQCVVLALLVGSSGPDSANAWTWIPAAMSDAVGRHLDALSALPSRYRLVLVDLALPVIRSLNKEQATRLVELIDNIIHADQQVHLFEFAVYEMIRTGLRETLGIPVPRVTGGEISAYASQLRLALSVMARAGGGDEAAAEKAFAEGVKSLGADGNGLTMMPTAEVTIDEVRDSLERLQTATMPVRRKILEAALACLMADGTATDDEVEVFRAFAASLEIPVPPTAFLTN